MTITHLIDNFLFELFPKAKSSEDKISALQNEITKFYTVGPYVPTVTVKDDFIEVTVDTDLIDQHQQDFKSVVSLCEKGKFDTAKQKLLPLIEKAPQVSEYHRVLGQIYSEEGDQDEAVNSLIDALRWDPKNGWALLMMGNIYAKFHKDIDTGLTYYRQAAKANPEDNITLNNIGAILAQAGKHKEAIDYFLQAKELDPEYPNTYYALALAEENDNHVLGAFGYAAKALKKSKSRDTIYQESLKLAVNLAQRLLKEGKGKSVVQHYTRKLEENTGTRIDTVVDDTIATAAKIEFAENYNRDMHIIRYKSEFPAVEHLIMHELVHLDFVTDARKVNKNQLFTSSQGNKTAFLKALEPEVKRLKKQGFADESVKPFFDSIFNGLNLQVYNTPIDLFIEDFIYSNYQDLRPYQFLSLYRMVQDGITATTDKRIVSLAPKMVLSSTKIYNLINALHLKDLYGIDVISDFNATTKELQQAQEFMEEFEEYRYDREAAEEYELVQNWGNDLQLDSYFELVPENAYRKGKTGEDVIAEMENSPFNSGEPDSYEEEQMNTFLEQHKDKDLNMAVVMYMVDALEYFQKLPDDEVKTIAHDIAMKGMYGIHPEKKDYSLSSIPGKIFTGYHLLAFYYVSWAIAEPTVLHELQLPFDKEYVVAKEFKGK
jgi:tetratricopeptide (TPR) repeat protein